MRNKKFSPNTLKILSFIIMTFSFVDESLSETSLLADRSSGCKLETGFDKASVGQREIEWTGNCANGLAQGFGDVKYFASGRHYWTFEVKPQSGAVIKGGKFKYSIDASKFQFKLTGCNRSEIHVFVEIPSGLDLKFSPVFWRVIKAGSDYASSQTIPYPPRTRNRPCPRYTYSGDIYKRNKNVVIVQNGAQVGWAKSTRRRYNARNSYEYGSETWVRWSNKTLIDAENHRNRVFRELKQERRRAEQARAAAARRAAAEKAAKQREAAAAARQAAIDKKVHELEKVAEADVDSRGRKKSEDSWCFFSSCDPTEHDGRLAFTEFLKKKFERPMVVVKFRKTNGAKGEKGGFEIYELYYTAKIELPVGFMDKRRPGQLSWLMGGEGMDLAMRLKSVMNFTRTEKKKWSDPQSLDVEGKLLMRKTEQGWDFVRLVK